jgi:hypothetical protein
LKDTAKEEREYDDLEEVESFALSHSHLTNHQFKSSILKNSLIKDKKVPDCAKLINILEKIRLDHSNVGKAFYFMKNLLQEAKYEQFRNSA